MPTDRPPPWASMPWALAFSTAAAMGEVARGFADQVSHLLAGESEAPAEPLPWTTPHQVRLELPTMRLRDFSTGAAGRAVLVTAPFALHTAVIADLAPGHSLIERLAGEGVTRLAATDWTSATPAMANFTLDTYLADLNVAVDELGPPVDLVGLCQGGSLALLYAARFPAKVRALVIVAAPVDTALGEGVLAAWARATPLAAFAELVRLGEGRMRGQAMRSIWPSLSGETVALACRDLELDPLDQSAAARSALARYLDWDRHLVDLPGPYYLEIVDRLFQRNLLAHGGLAVLGRTVGLEHICHPLYLVGGESDVITPPDQVFAAAGLARSANVVCRLWPGGHLGLFMGAKNLAAGWPEVARWLAAPAPRPARPRRAARQKASTPPGPTS